MPVTSLHPPLVKKALVMSSDITMCVVTAQVGHTWRVCSDRTYKEKCNFQSRSDIASSSERTKPSGLWPAAGSHNFWHLHASDLPGFRTLSWCKQTTVKQGCDKIYPVYCSKALIDTISCLQQSDSYWKSQGRA